MSAPTLTVRRAVKERDNFMCAHCRATTGLQFQHRRAVGSGGSKIRPVPVDGLTLCGWSNAACETWLQTVALACGWKVKRWVSDPSDVPVFYPHEFSWFRLSDSRRIQIGSDDATRMMFDVYGRAWVQWWKEARL